MIINTKGIVCGFINYKETSIITRIFTKDLGMQSFIVNGIRSSNSKKSLANYQPLTLLEMVSYYSPQKEIHRLNESKIAYVPVSFHLVKKSTILLFLAEILSKVLRHETNENLSLFEFLWEAITIFDEKESEFENFHIQFLLNLTSFLGFDLSNNLILEKMSNGDKDLHQYLLAISSKNFDDFVPSNGELRNKALIQLLDEYRFHIESLTDIKSLVVLQSVFH